VFTAAVDVWALLIITLKDVLVMGFVDLVTCGALRGLGYTNPQG